MITPIAGSCSMIRDNFVHDTDTLSNSCNADWYLRKPSCGEAPRQDARAVAAAMGERSVVFDAKKDLSAYAARHAATTGAPGVQLLDGGATAEAAASESRDSRHGVRAMPWAALQKAEAGSVAFIRVVLHRSPGVFAGQTCDAAMRTAYAKLALRGVLIFEQVRLADPAFSLQACAARAGITLLFTRVEHCIRKADCTSAFYALKTATELAAPVCSASRGVE